MSRFGGQPYAKQRPVRFVKRLAEQKPAAGSGAFAASGENGYSRREMRERTKEEEKPNETNDSSAAGSLSVGNVRSSGSCD